MRSTRRLQRRGNNAEVCDGTDIAELTAHNDRMRVNNQPAACSETQGRPRFFVCPRIFPKLRVAKVLHEQDGRKRKTRKPLIYKGFRAVTIRDVVPAKHPYPLWGKTFYRLPDPQSLVHHLCKSPENTGLQKVVLPDKMFFLLGSVG